MLKSNLVSLTVIFTILFSPLLAAKDLSLAIVYDNSSYNKKLETRWGFSCFVEGPEKRIMFDVGGEVSVLLGNDLDYTFEEDYR